MDLSGARPLEEAPGSRDPANRPTVQHPKEVGGGQASGTQAPSEAPESGGVLAASPVESGSIRDLAEPKQTKDRGHQPVNEFDREPGNKFAEVMTAIVGDTDMVVRTRLAIELDEKTQQPRFLLLSRETGEILGEIPEDHEQFRPLMQALAERGGILVDRRI